MQPTPMLKMNFEQDSTNNPGEWAAYFTDVQGSIYVGRATTPEAAVLDLASKIRQVQNQKAIEQARKKVVMGRVDISQWRQAFERSISQPVMGAEILGIPQYDNWDYGKWREAVNAASMPEKPGPGRIVWYYPVTGEVDAHKGGPMAAIVTKVVDQYTINLQIFLDGVGTRFVPGVDYKGIPSPGCWKWPTKSGT